jgi:catechol 2,3-dioxygenase-like lactoylglutathione lyase family enzyme
MAIELHGSCPLLMVFDMPKSLAFYRDILGFKVINDSGQGDESGWVWLRLNDSDLMLNTAFEDEFRPATLDAERQKNHEDTILYFGCPDVDSAYEYLREKGLQLKEPEITDYGFKAISLSDPDGYGIVLHWENK